MQLLNIFLALSGIMFILAIGVMLYLYFSATKKFEWSKNGNLTIKIDYLSRKMTPYILNGINFELQKTLGKPISEKKSNSLVTTYMNNVIKLWKGNEGEEHYMNVIQRAFNINEKHVNESFRVDELKIGRKLYKTTFNIAMDKIEERSDYILSIAWHSVDVNYLSNNKKETTIEKIVQRNELYKGFIALEVNHYIDLAVRKLISIIFQSRFDDYDYIYLSNILIIVCYENTYADVKKKTKQFVTYLNELNQKRAIGIYINGQGYAYFQGVDTEKDFHKAFATLAFLTNKSIREEGKFTKLKTDARSKEEFETFNSATKIFREHINNNDYEIVTASIKDRVTKQEVAQSISPKIQGIPQVLIEQILTSKYYRKKLYDSFVSYMLTKSEKITIPTIVNINSTWMMLNYEKFKNTKIIPCFSFKKLENLNSVQVIVDYMQANGFETALRLKAFDEFSIPQINAIRPSKIILDRNFVGSNILKSSIYSKLITLYSICKDRNIQLLYEDVPNYINPDIAAKIGLQYSYNTVRYSYHQYLSSGKAD